MTKDKGLISVPGAEPDTKDTEGKLKLDPRLDVSRKAQINANLYNRNEWHRINAIKALGTAFEKYNELGEYFNAINSLLAKASEEKEQGWRNVEPDPECQLALSSLAQMEREFGTFCKQIEIYIYNVKFGKLV